ncbi:thioesterase-like superfamily-domain-containing protein [Aspergillus pseudoustus]|uniref:Thioesterase-like superfamily-domain-containing protein n=1 Tax=Aspergillus pseudoustus TaxID=1810923 RepID=A0ABR4L1T3_9EURO
MPPSTTFEEAIQVQPQSSGAAYSADLKWDWSVGTAPNGGYIAAIFHRVATTHFENKHPKRHNSCARPISIQLSYIHRCQIGPATLLVDDIKIGARVSLIHVTLQQEGRSAVAGYLTISDEVSEKGITIPTKLDIYGTTLGRPPVVEDAGQSEWKKVIIPHPEFRRASSRVELYEQIDHTSFSKGVGQWARLRSDGSSSKTDDWSMESVAFLCDILPTALGRLERIVQDSLRPRGDGSRKPAPVWFPTLALNIDFKRCAMENSHEWLYSHIHVKSVHNGRMDVEIAILDAEEKFVAVATQVALVMSSERNLAKRNVKQKL